MTSTIRYVACVFLLAAVSLFICDWLRLGGALFGAPSVIGIAAILVAFGATRQPIKRSSGIHTRPSADRWTPTNSGVIQWYWVAVPNARVSAAREVHHA
jgi:hypothetical protein